MGAALPAALEARVRRVVRDALAADIERIEPIPGQLSLRRFARVFLADAAPEVLIARIETPADPRTFYSKETQ